MSMSSAFTAYISALNTSYTAVKTKIEFTLTQVKNHVLNVGNPHRVDKYDVGLGKVQNRAPASPEQAAAGANNNTVMSPKRADEYATANIYDPLITLFDATIADLDS
ncbi:hypothetical protein D3C75_1070140 [compost metagenome]